MGSSIGGPGPGVPVSTRVAPEIAVELDQLARGIQGSRATVIRKILTDWFEQRPVSKH